MSKYRWTLSKTLEYIRSKKIYIGLSEHFIEQLEKLEQILKSEEDKPPLTSGWRGPYCSQEEDLISKTYLNSQELPNDVETKKEKKVKRITWQDKIDKEKKKEIRENKMRQSGMDYRKVKSIHKMNDDHLAPHSSVSAKVIKQEQVESPLKQSEALKKGKNGTISSLHNKDEKKDVPHEENFT